MLYYKHNFCIRSVTLYYVIEMYMNENLLVNDDISVYWKKSTTDPSDTTTIINSPRSTTDSNFLEEYFLLASYTLGQYLRIERGVGQIILSEIVLEFSESHKAPPLKGQITYDMKSAENGMPQNKIKVLNDLKS